MVQLILATAIILIIVLFFVCVLVVPFNISLKLKTEGLKATGCFKLTWIKIKLIQKDFPDKKDEDKEKKEKKEEEKENKFDINRLPKIISLLYESSPYFIRIFNAFLKSTKIEKFSLNLIIGTGSPYDTAKLSGYLYSIIPIMNLIPNTNFFFEPDFINGRFEAIINLKIRIRLFWIVIESLRVVIKKPVRSLINELRKMR